MDVLLENLGAYADGFSVTVRLTVLSLLASLALGTAVATLRVSPVGPLRAVGLTYVELLRNTPLPVLFVLFVFGLPKVGIRYELFTSAVVVMSLYTGAFVAEALRSGINSISPGQSEAARALGLTFGQGLTTVILPQAYRTVVQPLGNVFIAMTKNTSIAATVSVVDLTGLTSRLITQHAQPLPILLGAMAAYMLLTLPSGVLVGAIERRVAIKR